MVRSEPPYRVGAFKVLMSAFRFDALYAITLGAAYTAYDRNWFH